MVDKPSSPQAERIASDSSKPSSPKGARGSPGASGAPTSPTRAAPGQDPTGTSSGPEPAESPEHLPQAPSPMDLGLLVGLSMVRAHSYHSVRNLCDNVHGLQSPYGIT
jgi:hypothetical protein